MRTLLQAIGIFLYSVCFQQLQAIEVTSGETESQLIEKTSRSDSKSKIKLTGLSGGIGATGATGEMGLAGTGFSEAYATAFQLEDVDLGVLNVGDIVQLPFSNLDFAKGITLDTTTNTFCIPKGVYVLDFLFTIRGSFSSGYKFEKIFLTLGASEALVPWVERYSAADDILLDVRSFSGSTIFKVFEESTPVQFSMEIREKHAVDPLILVNYTDHNYPSRIVFRKIADLS